MTPSTNKGASVTADLDKLLAAQSWPAPPTSQVEAQTIKLTIYARNDENELDSLPIQIASGRGEGAISFFDDDHQPLPPPPPGSPWTDCGNTSADGELVIYLCARDPIICTMLSVWIPPNHKAKYGSRVWQTTVVFFDYNNMEPKRLKSDYPRPKLVLNSRGELFIPPWKDHINGRLYGQYANIQATEGMRNVWAAVISNNNLVTVNQATVLSNSFIIPYQTINGFSDNNEVGYLIDTGANAFACLPLSFQANGTGLIMPDPDKGAEYSAPKWIKGRVKQPLTTFDIKDGLTLQLPMMHGVQEGDSYDFYIYINGYDSETGAYRQPSGALVFHQKAPENPVAGQKISCTVHKEYLLGYAQYGGDYGVLWADCQIKNTCWTLPWGPIPIDFTD